MGKRGIGVEICGNAIRVQLSLNGVIVRGTLRRDGTSQPPTSENLADARWTPAEIRARIKEALSVNLRSSRQHAITANH
jgi:hypothetical protein